MTGDADDLAALIAAARDGDRLALAAWVRRSQEDIWQLCAAVAGECRAAAMTERIFSRAYQSLATFRKDDDPRLWLLAVGCRLCSSEARRPQHPLSAPLAGGGRSLFAGLAFKQRLAMVLTGRLGLRYTEAAAVTGYSEREIRWLIKSGRDRLVQQPQPCPPTYRQRLMEIACRYR